MSRPALDLATLTVDERLELIQALWESLRQRPDDVPLSPAQRALVAERRVEHRRAPDDAIPWESVHAELWDEQARDEGTSDDRQETGERGG
jgi:putative addiction module component (TIGR02574 family)